MRIAINGFGRIGRAFFRAAQAQASHDIEIVAVNDLGDIHNLAYLLKYDSVYGRAPFDVMVTGGALMVAGKELAVFAEKDTAHLPWAKLGIDVVVESTGAFTNYEKANVHITAGARRVVITAPAKGESGIAGETVLVGVNEEKLKTCAISSNASCTTNAVSPLVAILDETVGIEKALLNTVHAYTASQPIVDGPSKKDAREGRAAAINIVPTSTGAASATAEAHTQLKSKFDGISLRVPVPAGSIADITFIARRDTTAEEVNDILRKAAKNPRWEGIFDVTDEPLVSSDIVGNPHAAIADLTMTRAIGNLVKVLAWYDNEWGYVHTLLRHVKEAGK